MSSKYETKYRNGKLKCVQWISRGYINHRVGGPYHISYYPNGQVEKELWAINGINHRPDGPAKVFYDKKGNVTKEEWWIAGRLYTPEELLKRNLDNQGQVVAHVGNYWSKIVEYEDKYYFVCGDDYELTDLASGLQRLEILGKIEYMTKNIEDGIEVNSKTYKKFTELDKAQQFLDKLQKAGLPCDRSSVEDAKRQWSKQGKGILHLNGFCGVQMDGGHVINQANEIARWMGTSEFLEFFEWRRETDSDFAKQMGKLLQMPW